jgi:hypothetical protein
MMNAPTIKNTAHYSRFFNSLIWHGITKNMCGTVIVLGAKK